MKNNEINGIKIKKRRGRKKKKYERNFTPEQVLDYVIANYPYIGLNKIKHKILASLVTYDSSQIHGQVFDILEYNGYKYYYDKYGNIVDDNAQHVGHIAKRNNGSIIVRLYFEIMQDDVTFEKSIMETYTTIKNKYKRNQ